MNNRDRLERSAVAGCFSCLAVFDPRQIRAWDGREGETAVCPVCDATSVLPGVGDIATLRAAHVSRFEDAETVPAVLSIDPVDPREPGR